MRNQPLLVSIIIGIIVVFVIVGASLVAKLSTVNKLYHSESLKNMELAKKNDSLNSKIASLEEKNKILEKKKIVLEKEIISLKDEIANDAVKIDKLEKYKEVLEDKLKDELIKNSNATEESKSMKR